MEEVLTTAVDNGRNIDVHPPSCCDVEIYAIYDIKNNEDLVEKDVNLTEISLTSAASIATAVQRDAEVKVPKLSASQIQDLVKKRRNAPPAVAKQSRGRSFKRKRSHPVADEHEMGRYTQT